MFPGINPKMMKQAMKKMGMKQEEIDASEVIIKCPDKEIVIKNPDVAKVDAMGQVNYQVSGDVEERSLSKFSEDDVETVVSQANCSEEEAKEVLERNSGDIAKSILELKK